MSALDELFGRCRDEGRAALIGYLPAGFPSHDLAVSALTAMIDEGVDAVEVGMPYTDPLMEGPVIQAALRSAARRAGRSRRRRRRPRSRPARPRRRG